MKHLLLFAHLYIIAATVNAQTDSISVAENAIENERFSFVSYEKNVMIGDSLSPSFDLFYSKLDGIMRNHQGRLNVLHYGGSHIQADVWSNEVRQALQGIDSACTGSRGLVFPYRAAGTNAPYSYKVTHTGTWQGHRSSYSKHRSTWGASGITATTTDTMVTLTFSFKASKTPVHVSEITVLSNVGQGHYVVRVPSVHDSLMSLEQTADGYVRIQLRVELDSFVLQFRKPAGSPDTLKVYGILLDNHRPGVAYHSIGVNGSSFKSYERCSLLQQQLAHLKPDLVIVSIGTNDTSEPDFDSTSFAEYYDRFLAQFRAVNPQCAFVLTVPNDSYIRKKVHNKNLVPARQVIYEMAKKYDARVWDFYDIMGGATSAKRWQSEGMMKTDLVHFTTKGYVLKGELFSEALQDDYERWFNRLQPVWND